MSKVLVVDDNAVNRQYMEALARHGGHEYVSAADSSNLPIVRVLCAARWRVSMSR